MMLPLSVFAQDVKTEEPARKVMKWEAGLNNAIAFSADGIYDDIFLAGRNSVSIYRNFRATQIGFVLEGGLTGVGDSWYLSPQVAVNYTIPFKKLYAYGGGAVGYVREQNNGVLSGPDMNGTLIGAQAGGVYNIGKRFGLNVEGGVRFKHMSTSITTVREDGVAGGKFTVTERVGYSDMYFPLSVGVRYRF